MDPRLHDALTRIYADPSTSPQVKAEIDNFIRSGGTTAFTGATLAVIRPTLAAQSVAIPLPPGQNPQGAAPIDTVAAAQAAVAAGTGGGAAVGGAADARGAGYNNSAITTSLPAGSPPVNHAITVDSGYGTGTGAAPANTPPSVNTPPPTPMAGQPAAVGGGRDARETQQAAVAAAPGGNATTPSGVLPPVGATPPAGGNAGGIPGGFSAAQETAVQQDDSYLIRFALKAAGFDPDHLTPMAKLAARALVPLVQARRAAFGLAGGGTGNDNGGAGIAQDIASFAKEFTTPGQNFYGHAKDYANSVVNSAAFQQQLAAPGMDPQKTNALYASFMPLMYGGANPLTQAAAQSTYNATQAQYGDADVNSNGQAGLFRDWLTKNPQYNQDPIVRSIYGLR